MAYVTETDLNKYLTENQVKTLSRENESSSIDFIEEAIATSEAYVKDRLNYKYDMDVELAKTGSDRNKTIIKIISMLAIADLLPAFDLYTEGREDDFKWANDNLDMIEKGSLLSDYLPAYSPSVGRIKYGTNDNLDLQY